MLKLKPLNVLGLSMTALLCGIGIFAYLFQQQSEVLEDKEKAKQTAILFFNAVSVGDSTSAHRYIWSSQQSQINSHERFRVFKNAQIIEVLSVDYTSAKSRPIYYQQFDKIISLKINMDIAHSDDAGHPSGRTILFVNLVQKDPNHQWWITEIGTGP